MYSPLHYSCRIVWLVAKVALITTILGWGIGVPGRWLDATISNNTSPYKAQLHRITLNPFRGIILHDLTLSAVDIDANAVLSADIIVQPDIREITKRRWRIKTIVLQDGRIAFPIQDENIDTKHVISVHGIESTLHFYKHEIHVAASAISDLGTIIHAGGIVRLPEVHKDKETSILNSLHELHAFTHKAPEWLKNSRERMRYLSMEQPPSARVNFLIDPTFPSLNRIAGKFHAGPFLYHERTIDGIDIEAEYAGEVLTISKFQIHDEDRRISVSGRYQNNRDLFNAHAFSDLSPDLLLIILPKRWTEHLASSDIIFNGATRGEAWIGPCSLKTVPDNWSGWLSAENAMVGGFQVQRAFASFKRENGKFEVENGLIRGGSDSYPGEATFTIRSDYSNQMIKGVFDIGLDVSQLKDILPPGLNRTVSMFEFGVRPPRFTGEFIAPIDDIQAIHVSGSLTGTNLVFRGVPLTGCQVGINYQDNRVILDPFVATMTSGGIEGSLDLDFTRRQYGINLDISTNPKSAAPMAGAKVAHYFGPYEFTDDVFVKVRGKVDVMTDEHTDLHVSLSGQKIDIRQFKFDRISLQARRTTGELMITNIMASIGQGSVTGSMAVTVHDGPDQFDLSLAVTNVSIDQLIAQIHGSSTNRYEGNLSGKVDLSGLYPDQPRWDHLNGTAILRIDEGRLMLIPVLGGLSTLISAVVPGLGFSEQNLLTASLTFKDGAIYSDDIRLHGNMISIAASGHYHWVDGLNFYVKAHPFRDGSIASAVRVVTIPISSLFEFKVTGPLRQPRWRTANLPL